MDIFTRKLATFLNYQLFATRLNDIINACVKHLIYVATKVSSKNYKLYFRGSMCTLGKNGVSKSFLL